MLKFNGDADFDYMFKSIIRSFIYTNLQLYWQERVVLVNLTSLKGIL